VPKTVYHVAYCLSRQECKGLSQLITIFGTTALIGPRSPNSQSFWITHNDAPQSIRLLWTSDQLVAENSTWQYTILATNMHNPGGNRTHNLNRRAAADLRLRPRDHWDRHLITVTRVKFVTDQWTILSAYLFTHLLIREAILRLTL